MQYKYNALGRTAGKLKWTNLALHCYMRNCACEGCVYKNMLESSNCNMKAAVLELSKEGKPEFRVVNKDDGTYEYVIKGSSVNGTSRRRDECYSKYTEYLSPNATLIASRLDLSVQQSIVVSLFLSGHDRDKVCSILKKQRSQVNSVLAAIYTITQEEVDYQTKTKKLEEFIKFYTENID